jgi:cell division protein FtsL
MNDPHFQRTGLVRNVILGLLLALIAFAIHSIFGQHGYLASRRQRKELRTLQQHIQQLREENSRLDKENRSLRSNPDAIERVAREQMHLAKPGEKIYTLPNKPPANPPPSAGKGTSAQP